MTTPTVIELPRTLEPTTKDSFIDSGSTHLVLASACLSSAETRALPAEPPRESRGNPGASLGALVHSARAGARALEARRRLVKRYGRGLRHMARSYGLAAVTVDDVVQTTWLNLFEATEPARDPMAIRAWLATATRRDARRRSQTHVRERLTDDPRPSDRPNDNQPDPIRLALEPRDGARSLTRLARDAHLRALNDSPPAREVPGADGARSPRMLLVSSPSRRAGGGCAPVNTSAISRVAGSLESLDGRFEKPAAPTSEQSHASDRRSPVVISHQETS